MPASVNQIIKTKKEKTVDRATELIHVPTADVAIVRRIWPPRRRICARAAGSPCPRIRPPRADPATRRVDPATTGGHGHHARGSGHLARRSGWRSHRRPARREEPPHRTRGSRRPCLRGRATRTWEGEGEGEGGPQPSRKGTRRGRCTLREETGAASYREREMWEEWEMREWGEETLCCVFIHGRVYRASSGPSGSRPFFSWGGPLGGPPPKMEAFMENCLG
jgi:hypothetical protein